MAYSDPYGSTNITFNISQQNLNGTVGPPPTVTIELATPLNLSAPVASDPVVLLVDGATQPGGTPDPTIATSPKVTLRPANVSVPPAAAFILGDGGPGSVSGAVTLRGLAVAGFGDQTTGATGGGVAAVHVWPSLTIEVGCTFENNLPAAVTVVGCEGAPAGDVVIQHAVIAQPMTASAATGVLVAPAFDGSLSMSSVSVTGGSAGVLVLSADARVRLTNVSVHSAAQIGLDVAAAGTAIVGGAVRGCGGDAGIMLQLSAAGSTVSGTVVRDNALVGIQVKAVNTTVVGCSVLGNGQHGIVLESEAADSVITATVAGNSTEIGIVTFAPRTRIERCSVGMSFDGTPCGNGGYGIYVGPGGGGVADGVADGVVAATVVGNNIGTGIITFAPRTRISNCSVGVSFDGTRCGNGGNGINLQRSATDSIIAATITAGNTLSGIFSQAPRTLVSDCSVGVSFDGTLCGNEFFGIDLQPTATDSAVTGTIVAGSVRSGIITFAPRTQISDCAVGASFDGTLGGGNGFHGISLQVDATDSVVTGTIAGNNAGHGIFTFAPRTRISDCAIGVSFDGSPCGNTGNGLYLDFSAMDSNISGTVSGNNAGSGIYAVAPRTRISNCSLGVSVDGAHCGNSNNGLEFAGADSAVTATVVGNNTGCGIVTTAPRTRIEGCSVGISFDGTGCGNGVDGIFVDADAADSVVATSVAGNHPRTGIITLARNTTIFRNTVGTLPNDRGINASNLIYGIRVAGDWPLPLQVRDNVIMYSGWRGLRVDVEDDGAVHNNTDNDDPDSHSGFALAACLVCDCAPIPVSATMSVVCDDTTDFGPDFPNSFPPNTIRIDMSGTKLQMVDWQQLRHINHTLLALDLSFNPVLDAVSELQNGHGFEPYQSLHSLVELNLDGTDLSRFGNNILQPIATQLQVLRLGNPSVPPADPTLSVNLTGTGVQLACLAWYDVSRCPVGYYNPVADSSDGQRSGQCTRCPVGTYQPLVGASKPESCAQCTAGFVDDDKDPTTKCTESGFKISTNWNASEITSQFVTTYSMTRVVHIVGVNRSAWPDGRLFAQGHAGTSVVFIVTVAPSHRSANAATSATIATSVTRVYTDTLSGDAIMNLTSRGNWTYVLEAQDESGKRIEVARHHFAVQPDDDSNTSNGPHGRDCAHGQKIDPVPFDQRFACDCSETAFAGDNCERWDTKSPSDDQVPKIIGRVSAGALAVLVGVLIAARVQVYRANQRPVDFTDTIELLSSAGMLLAAHDVDMMETLFPGPGGELDTLDAEDDEMLGLELDGDSSGTDDGDADASAPLPSHTMSPPQELLRNDLKLLEEIGAGTFATVQKAMYTPPRSGQRDRRSVFEHVVAVKVLREATDATQADFCREAVVSAQFSHVNVIGLLGVVTRGTPYLLVLQFCDKGPLSGIVGRSDIGVARQIHFAAGIAAGMAYLASRRFVHRDLASRNVLVDAADAPKIADFGMSRELDSAAYYRMTDVGGALPLRWCSPEVFEHQKFSEASDVWAFGITLIEVFDRAGTPYCDWTHAYVCERVKDGFQLPRPASCPLAVYAGVILPCFERDPASRPSFRALHAALMHPDRLAARDGRGDSSIPAEADTPITVVAGVQVTTCDAKMLQELTADQRVAILREARERMPLAAQSFQGMPPFHVASGADERASSAPFGCDSRLQPGGTDRPRSASFYAAAGLGETAVRAGVRSRSSVEQDGIYDDDLLEFAATRHQEAAKLFPNAAFESFSFA